MLFGGFTQHLGEHTCVQFVAGICQSYWPIVCWVHWVILFVQQHSVADFSRCLAGYPYRGEICLHGFMYQRWTVLQHLIGDPIRSRGFAVARVFQPI
jgi:hypothetical protein